MRNKNTYIFFKIITFVSVILGIQNFIYPFTEDYKLAQESYHLLHLKDACKKLSTPQIVFLGDSTVSNLFVKFEPNIKNNSALDLSNPGYNFDIYFEQISFIVENCPLPKIVLFPVNITALSPLESLHPGHIWVKERLQIKFLSNQLFSSLIRPLFVFGLENLLLPLTHQEHTNYLVNVNAEEKTLGDQFQLMAWQATLFIEPLDESHRLIKTFKKILKLSKDRNVKLGIYFAPVNYEKAIDGINVDYRRIMELNIKFIEKLAFEYPEIPLWNFATDLDQNGFTDQVHYSSTGSEKLAKLLDQGLRQHSLTSSIYHSFTK